MKTPGLGALGLGLTLATTGCAGKIDQVRPTNATASAPATAAPQKRCMGFNVSIDGSSKTICADSIVNACLEGTRRCVFLGIKILSLRTGEEDIDVGLYDK